MLEDTLFGLSDNLLESDTLNLVIRHVNLVMWDPFLLWDTLWVIYPLGTREGKLTPKSVRRKKKITAERNTLLIWTRPAVSPCWWRWWGWRGRRRGPRQRRRRARTRSTCGTPAGSGSRRARWGTWSGGWTRSRCSSAGWRTCEGGRMCWALIWSFESVLPFPPELYYPVSPIPKPTNLWFQMLRMTPKVMCTPLHNTP